MPSLRRRLRWGQKVHTESVAAFDGKDYPGQPVKNVIVAEQQ